MAARGRALVPSGGVTAGRPGAHSRHSVCGWPGARMDWRSAAMHPYEVHGTRLAGHTACGGTTRQPQTIERISGRIERARTGAFSNTQPYWLNRAQRAKKTCTMPTRPCRNDKGLHEFVPATITWHRNHPISWTKVQPLGPLDFAMRKTETIKWPKVQKSKHKVARSAERFLGM